MSRSRKKKPGGGMTIADSDKPFKAMEHRRERRATAAAIKRGDDPPVDNYGNPWKAPKDGKQYWADHDDRWMRK
jgi:hypothetical protein